MSSQSSLPGLPLHGGDIHSVRLEESGNVKRVVKWNTAGMPSDVFEKEADGLRALGMSFPHVPRVLDVGEEGGMAFLALEYISVGRASHSDSFGMELAALHRASHNAYGWEMDNYIGRLSQRNAFNPSWSEFYVLYRLEPMIETLRNQSSFSSAEVRLASKVFHRMEELFPVEKPSLLHGDLWSGNALVDARGASWLIDPAVYYGHREMDLAMMRLFGGFSEEVFHAYQSEWPLMPEWEGRVRLCQLYPVLVHAVLFGGHYVSESVSILKHYA